MNEYEMEKTIGFQGIYTLEEINLNKRLYEACSKEILDTDLIENLLKQGADPLGATDNCGWGLLEHVYEGLICDCLDSEFASVNLPKITQLFLKHGMNVSKPRIAYDGDNSIHPLWSFSFVPNENSIVALKMLLDNGLDVESAEEFWGHSIDDQINVHRDDPNHPDYHDWFVWTFKMIMLIASYENNLDDLSDFIGCSYNDYDTRKFRDWNNYYYEFDTSRCERYAQLYKSVVRIFETESKKEVWKIGINLEEGEF